MYIYLSESKREIRLNSFYFTRKEEYLMSIKEWGELYKKPVSEQEYREICANLYDFFYLIKNWDTNTKKGLNNG